MATSKDNKILVADYAKTFSDEVSKADSQYVKSLERLKRIRGARKIHQQRQLTSLMKTRESTDPRVLKMADRVSREQEMETYINISLDKNSLDKETVKDSYVLRGKVRGDNAKGLSGYTVQLQDAKNNVIGKPVKTDTNGNYSIIVDVKEGETIEKLNVAVLDKKNTLIQTDKLPVIVKPDVADTRDMLISSVDKVDRSSGRVLSDSLLGAQPNSKVKVSPRAKNSDNVNMKTTTKVVKAVTKKVKKPKADPKKPK